MPVICEWNYPLIFSYAVCIFLRENVLFLVCPPSHISQCNILCLNGATSDYSVFLVLIKAQKCSVLDWRYSSMMIEIHEWIVSDTQSGCSFCSSLILLQSSCVLLFMHCLTYLNAPSFDRAFFKNKPFLLLWKCATHFVKCFKSNKVLSSLYKYWAVAYHAGCDLLLGVGLP